MMLRHRIICLFMIVTLTVFTVADFRMLYAQELWNDQGAKGDHVTYEDTKTGLGNGAYFNATRRHVSTVTHGRFTLYNSHDKRIDVNTGLIEQQMRMAQEMNIAREQTVPVHWGRLSALALKNRQADTDLALQREYQRRLSTKNAMIKDLKEREKAMEVAQYSHMQKVAAYEAQKNAKKEAKAERKRRFLAGEQVQAYNRKSTRSSRSSSNSTGDTSSSTSGKKVIARKTVKGTKPKRLFNRYD